MKKLIKLYNKFNTRKRNKKEPVPINRILVVSNTALGDIILSTPAIKSLRKSFPNVFIELLVNNSNYKLFKTFEYVNKVTIYHKSLKWLLRYSRYLKNESFDTILFLHSNGPEDLFLALKSNVPNILKAINYPSIVSKEFERFILNTPDYKNKKHIIEHRIDLIRVFSPNIIDKTMSLPKNCYLNEKIDNNILKIGIQLAAADLYKMWPLKNYISLISKISKSFNNIKFIFFGLENENELVENVIENSKDIVYENLCGKTQIDELPTQLQKIDLLITNDTGTLHLAIALKIPTVSLFSPTDSKIFGPYQDFNIHTIIQKNGSYINDKPKKQRTQESMQLIEVDEVFDAVSLQIKRLDKCVE